MEESLNQVLETIEVPQNNLKLTQNERRSIIDSKIREYILKGKPKNYCLKYINDEAKRLGFDYTESQKSNIYYKVRKDIQNDIDQDREVIISDLASKLYYLYDINMSKEDFRECREVLRDIAKLVGINNNSVNISKNNNGDEIINIQFS